MADNPFNIPETELTVTTDLPASHYARIRCAGEIDGLTAPLLADAIDAAITPTRTRIEVDLREVTFVDSSGINTLVRARSDRYQLALVEVPPHIRRLFEITGLAEIFLL